MKKTAPHISEYKNLASGNSFQVISLVVISILLFVIFIFRILLPGYRDTLMDGIRESIMDATHIAYSLLEDYENDVRDGLLTREEAQARAISRIRALRYGPDMKNYFWITNMQHVMIMHPYQSDREGSDPSDLPDAETNSNYYKAVEIVLQNGEGYYEYLWPREDDPSITEPKLAFVKGFMPWGWIISSGVYLVDVNHEIASISQKAQFISFIIFFMMLVSMGAVVRYNIIANRSKLEIEVSRQQSEKLFRTVVNSSKDAMIAINPRGLITLFNPAAESVFGYTSSDVLGNTLDVILPEGYRKKHRTFVEDYFTKGTPRAAIGQTLELPAFRKDGSEITIDLSLSEGFFDEERFVLAVIRDITKRKELENRLQQSQKMESIGRLAGGIAHDFNNIMTAILGNSELAKMSLTPDSELYTDLEEIVENAKRAAKLTSQLLAFSRKQFARPTVVDMHNLIENMNKLLQRLISENIEFITDVRSDVWPVLVDPGQIEQVITNLVVNACDAMPDGGKLIIETQNVVLEQEQEVSDNEIPPGEYVLLKVTDSGMGMNEKTKAHLFEPFYTTKEKGKGTGLGLATCYGIVKQSKGYISVDSTEMVGTAISIYIPRTFVESTLIDSTSNEKKIPVGHETVLVVEDEISVQRMVVRTLSQAGYAVYEASNGKQAIHVLNTHEVHFDLMITDLVMPKMSGKELSDRVLKLYPALKILFMSGYIDDTIGRQSVLQKGVNFISKPFTPADIAQKVRDVLDSAE